jgi:two-component system, response regulator YesN
MLSIKAIEARISRNALTLKLLASFIGTAALSVLVVAVAFTFWFQRRSVENLEAMAEVLLADTTTRVASVFDLARRTAIDVYGSQDVSRMMTDGGRDRPAQVLASRYLSRVLSAYSQIHSIYVCGPDSVALGMGGGYVFTEGPGRIADLRGRRRVLWPIPRTLTARNGATLDLISFVYEDRPDADYAVVVNLQARAIRQSLPAGAPRAWRSVVVADADGAPVLTACGDERQAAPDAALLTAAARRDGASGHFDSTLDGRRCRVDYRYFDQGRLIAFSLSDYGTFFADIRRSRNLIVLTCLAVLAGVGAFGAFLYRRFYSPLGLVIARITSMAAPLAEPAGSGVRSITSAVGSIDRRLTDLERSKRARDEAAARSALFTALFLSRAPARQEELGPALARLGLRAEGAASCLVAVIRPGRGRVPAPTGADAVDLLLDSVERAAARALAPELPCLTARLGVEQVAVIAVVPEGFDGYAGARAAERLRAAQTEVRTAFGAAVSIGIGGPKAGFTADALREAYQEAAGGTYYRLVRAEPCLAPRRAAPTDGGAEERIGGCLRGLADAVRQGTPADFDQWLELLFDAVAPLPWPRIMQAFHEAATGILEVSAALSKAGRGELGVRADEAYERLKACESPDEVRLLLRGLRSSAAVLLSRAKVHGPHDMLERVFRDIETNYADRNLSANLIADSLGVSPQHFSRLFHERTGLSFPDYVNGIRMERARELLIRDHRAGITEICAAVGYGNASYFTTAFRKRYGVTPARYRRI